MTASLLKSIKFSPTAPRVVLLPDHRFFVRSVPVAATATPAEVTTQVELALETLSPFPTAQLYHGYFWTQGSEHALVFASYRKRFSTEQTAEWGNAELVIPTFATLAGAEHKPATTVVFPSTEGLTAIHWANGAVPSKVISQALPAEADEAARTQARDSAIKAVGESRTVVDLSSTPEITVSSDEKSLLFRAGDFTATLPVESAEALDVRDKEELAAMRRARSRDVILWRVLAGCLLAMGLFLLGEVGLLALGRPWQKSQMARISAQQPVVDRIMTAQTLATRIEELATQRLLAVEMLDKVRLDPEKRGSIIFVSTRTSVNQGLRTIRIDGRTSAPGELDRFRSQIDALPEVESTKIDRQDARAGVTSFILTVAFKPGALKPRTETASTNQAVKPPGEKSTETAADTKKSEPAKADSPTPAPKS